MKQIKELQFGKRSFQSAGSIFSTAWQVLTFGFSGVFLRTVRPDD